MTKGIITVDGDDFDPEEYRSIQAFKEAVYDKGGVGTWIDDMKLDVLWRLDNDEPIPEHLEPLLADADDSTGGEADE